MQVTLYRLRAEGKPLRYSAVLAQLRPSGYLVYGPWNGPAKSARLLAGGERVQARLVRAEIVRISNGCVLLQGEEGGHSQTWLCAMDEIMGRQALRKLRPPAAAEEPFAAFADEDLAD